MNALTLPDIAAQTALEQQPLDWVSMCGIALPLLLDGQRVAARADAGVSLDDGGARGIHRSRLYLALAELEREALSPALLQLVLQRFLDSHRAWPPVPRSSCAATCCSSARRWSARWPAGRPTPSK